MYKALERSSGPGLTGQVALGFSDSFAITSQLDFFGSKRCVMGRDLISQRYDCLSREDTTERILYGGVRFGSAPGLAAGLLTPVVAFVVIVIACSTGCGLSG
jgi:hypothetical protein